MMRSSDNSTSKANLPILKQKNPWQNYNHLAKTNTKTNAQKNPIQQHSNGLQNIQTNAQQTKRNVN